MIKAVLFDIDGTLVDSNDFHVLAWQEAFRRYGKTVPLDALHRQMGKGGDQLVPVFCSEAEVLHYGHALDRLQAQIFTERYLPLVQPFACVRELFERIRDDGPRIALASSSKAHEVEAHAHRLQVEDVVDAITSADDVQHSKPCPDVFEAARARLSDVAADEAIVVGDTPYDAIAARNAGMRMLGMLCGGFTRDDLLAVGALEVYRDPADLLHRYADSWLARGAASRGGDPKAAPSGIP